MTGSRRGLARFALALTLALIGTFALASSAGAAASLAVVPEFPASVSAGASNVAGSVSITNTSNGAEATMTGTVSGISLTPSCGTTGIGPCAAPDLGVFTLSSTAMGRPGTRCEGVTFTVGAPDSNGSQSLTAQSGWLLGPVSSKCVIDFTMAVNRVPSNDSSPSTPGVQTTQNAFAVIETSNGAVGGGYGLDETRVDKAAAQVSATTPSSAPIGSSVSATASVTGASPSGSVVFSLYGPDDASCAGAPIFTNTKPLSGGRAQSEAFTPSAKGVYRYTAAYSGDANNNIDSSGCNEPNQNIEITSASPTLSTTASGAVTVGAGSIQDTATLASGFNPTGTVTFTLFGPDNSTCSGTPVFTSTKPVNFGNGNYVSDPFTPTAPGKYQWIVTYSGDANNTPVTAPCNDANGSVIVRPVDTDGDGVPDAADNCRIVSNANQVNSDRKAGGDACDPDDDNDGLSDVKEAIRKTSRLDMDTDDDGVSDGREVNTLKTRPTVFDTDGDRVSDGVETGVRRGIADPVGPVTATSLRKFRRDRDPNTRTKPTRRDTDRDGLSDGAEDKNRNGRRDRGETNPLKRDTDGDGFSDKKDRRPLDRRRS